MGVWLTGVKSGWDIFVAPKPEKVPVLVAPVLFLKVATVVLSVSKGSFTLYPVHNMVSYGNWDLQLEVWGFVITSPS